MKKLTETERGDLARRRTEALERIADALQGHDEDPGEGLRVPLADPLHLGRPVAIVQLRGRVREVHWGAADPPGLFVDLLEIDGEDDRLKDLASRRVLLQFAETDWPPYTDGIHPAGSGGFPGDWHPYGRPSDLRGSASRLEGDRWIPVSGENPNQPPDQPRRDRPGPT